MQAHQPIDLNDIKNNYRKKKDVPKSKKDLQNFLVDAGVNVLSKNNKNKLSLIALSRITLANNEITDIAKVISSLENRGILLKKTTTKNRIFQRWIS